MIPARMLWPVGLSRQIGTVEADGTVSATWTDLGDFPGRIARRGATETTTDGRQAGVDSATLLTNQAGIRAEDRIVDDVEVWEVQGRPVAVWNPALRQVHHYEAPLRRVEG